MHFQKPDLVGTHYNWVSDEKSFVERQPNRRSFDRFNGHQVLFLINFYGATSDKFTVQEGKSIEQRILHELPDEAKSEISVYNWIKSTVLP